MTTTTLLALLPHYAAFYTTGTPLWTERIGEWMSGLWNKAAAKEASHAQA